MGDDVLPHKASHFRFSTIPLACDTFVAQYHHERSLANLHSPPVALFQRVIEFQRLWVEVELEHFGDGMIALS